MRCAEFENRLNDVLDERLQPGLDQMLVEHTRHCENCAEQLAACEIMLDGARSITRVQLQPAMVSRRVLAATAGANLAGAHSLELSSAGPIESISDHRAALQMIPAQAILSGFALSRRNARRTWIAIVAVAAAMLIALPWLQGPWTTHPTVVEADVRLPVNDPSVADSHSSTVRAMRSQALVEHVHPTNSMRLDTLSANAFDGEPIAWVGYHVADGMKPVASSMVSALNALRKQQQLWLDDDTSRRSSFLERPAFREMIA